MGKNNGKTRREKRRQAAEERKAERDKLSPKEQLKLLDERLGKGQGAKKERKRLRKKAS